MVGAPSPSAFARIFQFGMRHGMRSYTIGSAWWKGDCGPYLGAQCVHPRRAVRRALPPADAAGRPPLGGHVLSHDQIEAALMRRAGYEVRVLPTRRRSWEDNPPTLLEFTKRDLRWCQGNMQYCRLLALCRGCKPRSAGSRSAWRIAMYIGPLAWMVMIVLSALKVFEPEVGPVDIGLGVWMFAASFAVAIMPKLMGMLDVV